MAARKKAPKKPRSSRKAGTPRIAATVDAATDRELPRPQAVVAADPVVPFPIVGIGASAGGLEPLSTILHGLTSDTCMAFVLVQHLNPTHTSMLCELALPSMDGFEIARRIRRDRATQSPRLIAVTGYGQDDDRRSTRDAGFDYHITKPPDLEVLLALIADSDRGRVNAR